MCKVTITHPDDTDPHFTVHASAFGMHKYCTTLSSACAYAKSLEFTMAVIVDKDGNTEEVVL